MTEKTEPYECKFKVAMVGDSGVGKHTLIEKASTEVLKNRFVESLGIKLSLYCVKASDEKTVVDARILIWGITASLKDKAFRKKCESGIQGLMVVADASRPDTIEHVPDWLERIPNIDTKAIDKVLVLNKTDLASEEALAAAKKKMKGYSDLYKAPLILTSCEDGKDVKQPFRELAKLMCMRPINADNPCAK